MRGRTILRTAALLSALALLLLLLPLTVHAGTTLDRYTYVINEDGETVTVTGYTGTDKVLTIPTRIERKPVTAIGDSAFAGKGEVAGVRIPDTVTSIGKKAFFNCWALSEIALPAGLTSLGAGAFQYCERLTSVTLPAALSEMDYYAFLECVRLKEIRVEAGNPAYSDLDGVLYNADKTVLLLCPLGRAGEIALPDSVAEIRESAFAGCEKLETITLPEGITHISPQAFADCTGLTGFTVPSTVTHIEMSAFSGCTGLASVTLPGGLEAIGPYAFSNCSALTSLSLPEGLKTIGESAFSGCAALSEITFPESLTSIGNRAFNRCDRLTTVHIPAGVTDLGLYVFAQCKNLTSITVDNANPVCADIDGVLISPENRQLIQFPCGRGGEYTLPEGIDSVGLFAFEDADKLTAVTLPAGVKSIESESFRFCDALSRVCFAEGSGVTEIPRSAFEKCYALKEVLLPNGLTSIGDSAFYHCVSLAEVHFPPQLAFIGKEAFSYCGGLKTVILPDSLTSVGINAFAGCVRISLISVGPYKASLAGAFPERADEVILREGATAVPEQMFQNFGGRLAAVTLPDSVVSIGNDAFLSCGMAAFWVPEQVTELPSRCLYIDALEDVYIPPAVTHIDPGAFHWSDTRTVYGCTGSAAQDYAEKNSLPFVAVNDGNRVLVKEICTGLVTDDYTAASLKPYMDALADAKALLKTADPTPARIEEALAALRAAKKGFELRPVDFEGLKEAIAKPIGELSDYAYSTAQDYGAALALAKATLTAPGVTQRDVVRVWQTLNTAQRNLKVKPLNEITVMLKIKAERAIRLTVDDLTPYSRKSAAAYVEARNALKQIMEEKEPLPSRVAACLDTLAAAEKALEPPSSLGDADGDGDITSTDARLALQVAVNKIGAEALTNPDALDADGDGKVTSTDARLILQWAVGKIKEWP